jgi:alcohol dehydrogenase (cytochrome c)
MISTRNLLTVAVACVIGLLPWVVTAQGIDNYSAVTEARLLKPEPQNWLMYRRTYDGRGYSPLDQIKTTNVKKLVPVWTLSSGMVEGHESPPIVNNGVMFLTTPQNQVLALNAKTGDILWRYKKELPEDLTQLHPTNRGVGLLEDKVYLATVDCHLLALDAKLARWSGYDRKTTRMGTPDSCTTGSQGQGRGGHLWGRTGYSRLHCGL